MYFTKEQKYRSSIRGVFPSIAQDVHTNTCDFGATIAVTSTKVVPAVMTSHSNDYKKFSLLQEDLQLFYKNVSKTVEHNDFEAVNFQTVALQQSTTDDFVKDKTTKNAEAETIVYPANTFKDTI